VAAGAGVINHYAGGALLGLFASPISGSSIAAEGGGPRR
jgi:hypothetical protein